MSSMFRRGLPQSRGLKRALQALAVMLTATVMFAGSAFAAWAANNITITFVRHGESEGNVSCCIDTTIPGPNLTANGQAQAQAVAQQLATDGVAYDGIYYSDMVRTQQTAAPFEKLTGLPETELPGLHEVQAGIYEGAPQNSGFERLLYALPAFAWATGNYAVPIPGSADLTGANFESRFNGAVQTIYNSGNQNPVVFSHGLAIMAWTLMNVQNPDLSLMFGQPLGNTAVVTVTGNPTDGWTLVNWAGTAVSQNPALPTKLFVDVRNMITAPQMAVYNVVQAFGSGNIGTIANAIRDGVFNSVQAVVNFPGAVVNSVAKSIQTGTVFQAAPPPAAATTAAATTAAATTSETPAATSTSATTATTTEKPVVTALNAKKVTPAVSDSKSPAATTATTPIAEQTAATTSPAETTSNTSDTKQSTSSGDSAGSNPAKPAKDSNSAGGQQKSDDTAKPSTTSKTKSSTSDSDSAKPDKSTSSTSGTSKSTSDAADKPKPKGEAGGSHSSPAAAGAGAGSSGGSSSGSSHSDTK